MSAENQVRQDPFASQAAEVGRGADLLSLLAAVGIGATAMYFWDPARGKRRRHLAADRIVHAGRVATDAAGTTKRDLANRVEGAAALARRPFTDDAADDLVIAERVRAELGRAVSHPGAIDVNVSGSRVTLSGPVLRDEAERLLSAVRHVRGVEEVDDRLERHDEPGTHPALQGSPQRPARTFEFLQENWSPAARLLATAGGAALVAASVRGERRSPVSALLGIAGAALALRGAANMPFDRLLGIGAGRRGVSVQKSVNIAAPIDDVFAWLTSWERWPHWMSHVREVRPVRALEGGHEQTHWVVDGPAGATIEWDAITTGLQVPTHIAWKTVDGSPVAHEGTVRLVPTDQGHTRVDVQLSYNPIAGAAGHAVARLFRRDPKHQLEDDLARLKTTIETGRPPHDAAFDERTVEALT